MKNNSALRKIPSINDLLKEPKIRHYAPLIARDSIVLIVRQEVAKLRTALSQSSDVKFSVSDLLVKIELRLQGLQNSTLKPVINATGIVLNTNLGRAPFGNNIILQMLSMADDYINLEFDLAEGSRGRRNDHMKKLSEFLSAEAVTVVNNNAAAVFLVLKSLAEDREVVISRGELIEIGGGFRIPDILNLSGAKLVEVGTTNRTRYHDYEKAITGETAILLKTHRSNFSIQGFHEEPAISELVGLASKFHIPIVYDLGSGLLRNNKFFKEDEEPSVEMALKAGVDLVLFSGDKLLCGPQCGIIAGRKDLIDLIEKHPLMRTFRVCKMTILALDAVLSAYLCSTKEWPESLPIYKFLSRSELALYELTSKTQRFLQETCPDHGFTYILIKTSGKFGGGTTPNKTFPSYAIAISHNRLDLKILYLRLLALPKPIVGTFQKGHLVLDFYCISEHDIDYLQENLSKCLIDISLSEQQAMLTMEKLL